MTFTKLIHHVSILALGSALCFPVATHAQKSTPVLAADTAVNSRFNEIKPLLSPDGQTLYFSRSNHLDNAGGRRDKGDIWTAPVQSNGNLGPAQHVNQPFNTADLNTAIGFSADGREMFYQAFNPETKGMRNAGIYKVSKEGGKPKAVKIHYFFNGAKYQDATISPDGKVMLLSLESYSTYGLEDLYVSFLQPDNSWSEPKNLGSDINTPKQEMAAWLSKGGRTLYFTSNGHGGYGSMDIFRSTRLDASWKRWSKPENLGAEVNSKGADMYYSEGPKGEWAWFSSTQNSEGYGDIRKVKVPPLSEEEILMEEGEAPTVSLEPVKPPVLKAQVEQEEKTEPIEDVTVLVKQSFDLKGSIQDEEGKLQAAQFRISQPEGSYGEEAVTNGNFSLSLPEAGAYKVRVQAPGYFAIDTLLEVKEGENAINLRLKPLRVGETVRLQNVMFRQSTAVLMEESNEALDEVVAMMKDNPQLEILLTGHTDNQGSSRANIRLSRERVEAVKKYMISRGIEEERIEGKGLGGTKPVASNANEESRKLNRRVEFMITRK